MSQPSLPFGDRLGGKHYSQACGLGAWRHASRFCPWEGESQVSVFLELKPLSSAGGNEAHWGPPLPERPSPSPVCSLHDGLAEVAAQLLPWRNLL